MRRRSVAVVWVGVCLVLAGCKGAAEEAKAPPKPVAAPAAAQPGPGCDGHGQPECARPAHVSDGTPVTNEEYGILAVFPAGSRVCEGLSGSHPHGFYTRLGDDRMECRPSRDAPPVSAISIWGDGNSAFYKTLEEATGEACRTTGVGDHLTAPDGRPFRLKGLVSRVCERPEANGGFSIEVTAMAGRWGGADEDADTPYVIYRAGLTTTPDRLAADKILFQRFLDGLVLTPPHPFDPEIDCRWTRGVLYLANGTPGWRIRLRTGRVLGVSSSQGPEGPHVLPDNARQAFEAGDNPDTTEVSGEWQVCPYAPDRPGWMRPVFLTGARKLTTGHR